jgi:multicomponent Na+:H+ antiporter subunit D
VLAGQTGGWPAPFGITLVADVLSAVMVAVTALVGLASAVYALADIDPTRARLGFPALLHVLLGGVCGAFLTGDLFNLYVWFEVMLMASFGLLVLGGTREQIAAGMRYVALNLIATFLLLCAVGLLHARTGALNLADLHLRLAATPPGGAITPIALMFVAAFGIKSALFPLFFWLPASYHTTPAAVAAPFAGLLTKVGVYALLRTFTLLFAAEAAAGIVLLALAMLTMAIGVLGATAQGDVRRILSFHIISQIGYMALGVALATPLGLASCVFYLVHHIVVKANLFLIGGVVRRLAGSDDLSRLGGFYRARPLLAALFLVPALSLAGMPPLSGFWAKLLVIRAAFAAGHPEAAAVALAVGLLTLYSMIKIWNAVFWRADPGQPVTTTPPSRREMWLRLAPATLLAAVTLAIGLWPEPLWRLSARAAALLLDPAPYVAAVLGGRL